MTTLHRDPIEAAHQNWVEHGWAGAADGMVAITSLMRAQQIALARVEAVLKPMGVTFSRYELLMLLVFSKRGALPMSVVSSRLQVHQSSVTNAVDRLEGAGLVSRLPHPEDRRATLVEITQAGRSLAAEATDRLNAEVFGDLGLSDDDITDLVRILTTMRRSAGDF
ncbi:MarR family winged helix-turn-helix transcriptional regulator [Kribbia dieselivorans]|uniref:MarR family winged helix-turn-helix transcriptional regulator n=1 Tax=Kribbia dieselivorans TaxID=331526 RepID=UPI000838D279|nr:MarR family transcriptional regulator [Kribbia dieselivorans]